MPLSYVKGNESRRLMIVFPDINGSLSLDVSGLYTRTVFADQSNKAGREEGSLVSVNKFIHSRTYQQQVGWFNYLNRTTLALEGVLDTDLVIERCQKLFTPSTEVLGFRPADIHQWVCENVPVPNAIMEDYKQDNEGNFSRAKTYIKREYLDLATLVIYAKLMAPLFGRYATVVGDKLGSRIELSLIQTLEGVYSRFPGYVRIVEFVQTILDLQKDTPIELILIKNIPTVDIGTHVVAVTVLRRLVQAIVLACTDRYHLVSHIHTGIQAIINPTNRPRIDDKNPQGGGDSDDQPGAFDDTRARYPLTVGQMAIMSHTTTITHLEPFIKDKIDMSEYESLLASIQLVPMWILPLHLAIVSSVFQHVINPIIIPRLDSMAVIRLMVIAHLLLKGHPTISALVLASPVLDDQGTQPMTSMLHLTGLSKAVERKLVEQYPLRRMDGKLYNRVVKQFLIIEHIDEITKCVHTEWVFQGNKCPIRTIGGYIIVPEQFKDHYAHFLTNAHLLLDPPHPDTVLDI